MLRGFSDFPKFLAYISKILSAKLNKSNKNLQLYKLDKNEIFDLTKLNKQQFL